MSPDCALNSLSLILISLIGVSAFVFGYLAGHNRRKSSMNHP
jgi:hypothetical protein